MRVNGHDISADIVKAVEARMFDGNRFTAGTLADYAYGAGAPHGTISVRVADRLIQWHRKRMNIRRTGDHSLGSPLWQATERAASLGYGASQS